MGSFLDPTNAFACDDTTVAMATGNNDKQTYSVYGLNVPPTAIVTGIQVRVRATDGTKNNRKLQVSLSWDGGMTFTTSLNTRNFRKNAPLRDFIVGGSAVLWGHAWTPAQLSDANFRVRLNAKRPGGSGDDISLDCVPVTVFYQIPGAPNLTIEKVDSPDPVQPLQNITYTITYSNTGESTATNVIISDTTPTNTTFVSASPSPASAPSVGGTGSVSWNVGSVAPGGSGAVTLVVKVNAGVGNGTQIVNDTYSIDSDQNAPSGGNAVSTTVQGTIALSFTKSDNPDPVAPGETLTYVLTVTNNGNVASVNIIVNEAYDGNVVFSGQSSSSNCATFGGAPDNDQWTITSLGAGLSCQITVTTTVNSPLADGVLLFNTADIVDDAAHTAEASAITTVHSPCGDGVVTGEECDEGAANGTAGSCCTSTCTFRANGEVCRSPAGACDVQETCSGSGGTCPADLKSSALCRGAAGVCDVAESCDGSSNDCPADAKSSALCRAAAGVCDVAETCDGSSNDCPADAKSTTTCRVSAGVCDPAEACDGSNDDCPADAKSTALCRASGGVCDLAEACDGSSNNCPVDAKSSGQCRAAAGVCDLAESCDGSSNDCPADTKSTAPCRASAGACDIPEACNGSSDDCPADAKSTAQCRAAAGVCDVAESCDGGSDDCPSDGFESASTICRAASTGEACDVEEFCTGTSATCPADAVEPNTTVCRAAAGACDLAESCDGATKLCPADVKSTALCRATAGVCDEAETCSGSSDDCPADAKSTAECRASAGVCDLAEACDGSNNDCPTDAKSMAQCRASAGICDQAENCDGMNNGCPADAKSTATCRGSAGACDPAEACDGATNDCPADAKSTAQCRASAGACDLAETCDGSNNDCPTDAKSTAVCRASAGPCDVAESCDGISTACPADQRQPDSTSCSDSQFCNGAETCMAGLCTAGADPCPTSGCSETSDMCVPLGCSASPETGCLASAKSLLLIKDKSNDGKDKLIWKWIKGAPTDKAADFADPTTTANYALCIYSGNSPTLAEQILVPPGSKWTEFAKGYKYFDGAASADGVQKLNLKSSTGSRSKALLKARGTALPDLTPAGSALLPLPVTVQLVNQHNGNCFEATYTAAKKNTTAQFKAKK